MNLAYLAWIVVCVVWGTVYLGIRMALESVPVALLPGLRSAWRSDSWGSVLVWPELTLHGQEGEMFIDGILALQLACVGWALGTSYTKRNAQSASPLSVAAIQMLLGGVTLIAFGTVTGEWQQLSFTALQRGR